MGHRYLNALEIHPHNDAVTTSARTQQWFSFSNKISFVFRFYCENKPARYFRRHHNKHYKTMYKLLSFSRSVIFCLRDTGTISAFSYCVFFSRKIKQNIVVSLNMNSTSGVTELLIYYAKKRNCKRVWGTTVKHIAGKIN